MSRRLLAGTLVLGAAILAAVFALDGPKPVYAHALGDFLARPVRDTTVRLDGALVPGSLCRFEAPCGYSFRMQDRPLSAGAPGPPEPTLAVRYPNCIVPDTFCDIPGGEMSLTVEGTLCTGCHVFEASRIMAKCPSKYQVRRDGRARPIPPCSSKEK